jgi:hypothetical protein
MNFALKRTMRLRKAAQDGQTKLNPAQLHEKITYQNKN